jgi:hypothetical protein
MDLFDAFNRAGVFAKLSLLVGFVPLGLAGVYLLRPSERRLLFMRPVSLAAIFAAITGVMAGGIAVLLGVSATGTDRLDTSSVFAGLAESLVPAFVNFGCLAAAWLLIAVGMLRREG